MSFRSFIYHNFWLKLFSFVLAMLIWFVVYEPNLRTGFLPDITTPKTVELQLPVTIIKQPGDARVFRVTPEKVEVTLTGEDAVLRELIDRKEIKAYVDMSDVRQPENPSRAVVCHVARDGVAVMGIRPRAVEVERVSP